MFDPDFFPTPPSVIDMMDAQVTDRVVMDPSAGSGNMLEWCKLHGAREVIACEKHPDLAKIAQSKGKFLKADFLDVTPAEVSHVQVILMNPPFSAGARHVLHAWSVAPAGCEIVSLINSETLENTFTRERKELERLISDYGHSADLGQVFKTAERRTDVEVSVIKLFKPGAGPNEFEGFFFDEDEEQQGTGIMEFNAVRDIVQRYVYSVKKFDEIMALAKEMDRLNEPFKVPGIKCEIGHSGEGVTDHDTYKKELQKKAWAYLFDMMNLEKYVTSGVMRDINSFVESQTKVPFTMKNVYRMFEIIVGTREETFNRSLVEAVDKFTAHTHENRFQIEGWKTNAGHLLNQKFITPHILSKGYSGYLSPIYGHRGCYSESIEDLVKVICSIEGKNYDRLPRLRTFCHDIKMQPNVWYEWDFKWTDTEREYTEAGFFQVKGFLKGTMHVKFRSRDVWARLNQRYAKIKGQALPESNWKRDA